jgi:hypothetical protein
MVLAAGGEINAADLGVWTNYTPTWSSSGTQPVLNNGSIAGRYVRIGDTVIYLGKLLAGSTTTFGTGTYAISLPLASNNFLGGNGVIGSCWVRDASGNDYQGQLLDTGTTFAMRPGASTFGGNAQWSATAPMTMANGDWISWCAMYEAA